jgi:uncharacterized damage-inducible protein DinB
MTKSKEIADLITVWQEVHWNTTEFINSLGDEGLKTKLPRGGLNTFCKHFQEMLDAQNSYINAIKTGEMRFDEMAEDYSGDETAENLLSQIEELDNQLIEAIENAPDDLKINWPDGEQSLAYTLSNLQIHEIFHIGQLIAFCYATRTPLPQPLVESWFLTPLDEE